jgi:hypothetical protein
MHTVNVRRVVAAPIDEVFDWVVDGRNWGKVPGMIYARVRVIDGPEPFGVGSIRELLSSGSKVTEVVTGFERPHFMSYKALSTIPPARHDGGSMTFRAIPEGTEVLCSSTFEAKTPMLANFVTSVYGHLTALGFRMILRTAERALTRSRPK